MIDFFASIWNWYQVNRENIITFVTSSTFVGTVFTIITYVKNRKSVNLNTLSINDIKKTFEEKAKDSENVAKMKKLIETSYDTLDNCINRVVDVSKSISDFQQTLSHKLNSMLEVQSIVYSTIKDDTIRNTVNSILISAKHDDLASRVELEKEIEDLKHKIADTLTEVNKEVNSTVNKVSDLVIGTPTENVMENATKVESMRY